MTSHKVAVVHDYFTQTGGAERVALALADAVPNSPIYTSLYAKDRTFGECAGYDIRTSVLQGRVPVKRFRLAAPLFGPTFRRMDLSKFETLLISTSGFAHHVRHPNTFVYCHTPPHFLYDLENYLPNSAARAALRPGIALASVADRRAVQRHSRYIANSHQTARKIHQVYGRRVEVIHPPFSTSHLPQHLTVVSDEPRALIVARLLPYKRIDIAIRACKKVGIPLTIVGVGPDMKRLVGLSDHSVEFVGRLTDQQMAEAFSTHSLVIMPGVEDFGLAPLEANYSGRPVVARASGGALETVVDGHSGLLVDSDSVDAWADAIKACVAEEWRPETLRQHVEPFGFEAFQVRIRDWIASES